MKIGDEYEITADKYNFILRQWIQGEQVPRKRETYYRTFEAACNEILAREQRKSMDGSALDVIRALSDAQRLVCASIAAAEELPRRLAA